MNDPSTIRRLYGRRSGHKLRAGQEALLEQLLPAVSVPEPGPVTSERYEVQMTQMSKISTSGLLDRLPPPAQALAIVMEGRFATTFLTWGEGKWRVLAHEGFAEVTR